MKNPKCFKLILYEDPLSLYVVHSRPLQVIILIFFYTWDRQSNKGIKVKFVFNSLQSFHFLSTWSPTLFGAVLSYDVHKCLFSKFTLKPKHHFCQT